MGKLWTFGALLLAVSGCRSSQPPQIILCIGDGLGGADCDVPGVGKEYWPPTKLQNAWITTQDDMAKFAAWCFDTNLETAKAGMLKIHETVSPSPSPSPVLDKL